jgi:hypothetical protein
LTNLLELAGFDAGQQICGGSSATCARSRSISSMTAMVRPAGCAVAQLRAAGTSPYDSICGPLTGRDG